MGSDTVQDRRKLKQPCSLAPANWWHVLKRVAIDTGEDNLSLVAAGCAFYAMLALVPSLAALVLTYGLIADPADVTRQIEVVSRFLPDDVATLLHDQLTRLTSSAESNLGWGLITALAIALWSSSAGIKAMLSALNIAFRENEKRNILVFNLIGLGFTLLAIIAFIVMMIVIVGVPAALAIVGLGQAAEQLMRVVRWPLLGMLIIAGIGFLYRYGPSRSSAKLRWITPGAVIATILWITVSIGFSLYVSEFASYNRTYGSLGAIVVMLLWLYLSAFVIILGAKINGEIEHETAIDTTAGPPKPLGSRGAFVADHVAGVDTAA